MYNYNYNNNWKVITKTTLLAKADPSQDHSRILRAAINRPPADWRRRAGRPRRTWLRTIELDLRPHNLGLNTAWMRAQDRSKWRQLVETAMLIAHWWARYSMMVMARELNPGSSDRPSRSVRTVSQSPEPPRQVLVVTIWLELCTTSCHQFLHHP